MTTSTPFGFIEDSFSEASEALNNLTGNNRESSSFQGAIAPSVSGFATRQSRVQNERPGVTDRKMVHWLVPEGPIVQMYINPQSITYSETKAISETRSKGGFIIQYWGEDLLTLRISGTTGSSGYEGINVLRDVYRNEQLALDPYALFQQAEAQQDVLSGGGIGGAIGGLAGATGASIGATIGNVLLGPQNAVFPQSTRPRPSLAALATQVEMYWSGEVFRGFFKSFSVTESVANLGMFDYEMEFKVTQKRGFRTNFLAWHRSATSGPSNNDKDFGNPYSFGPLLNGDQNQQVRTEDIVENIVDLFNL